MNYRSLVTRILKVGSLVRILSVGAGGVIAGTGTASRNIIYVKYLDVGPLAKTVSRLVSCTGRL